MQRKVFQNIADFKAQNEELSAKILFQENTDVLKKELIIGNKVFKNRLACQAMEGCDGKLDGTPDELTIRRYDRLASGGSSIIWYEATAVMNEGRANPRQLYIDENNLDAFKAHVERIKETALKANGFEPVVFMQATHSGRYSKPEGTPAPLIAYNNPLFEKDNPIDKSRIVTDEYLDRVGEKLIEGARLAEKAGFDGVDIKCCHRYLNSELLSAYNREGKYGGSLENRTRLLRESVKGAMDICSKDFLVSTRVNMYDGFPYPYGFGVKQDESGSIDFDPTEGAWLLKELYNLGMKIVNITMGNPYVNPHVNRPFASGGYDIDEHPLTGVGRMLNGIKELKKSVPDMAVISSALSYLGVAAPGVSAAYVENGGFDFAGFGRTILAYPDFAKDIIELGEMKKEKICIACSKCTQIMRTKGGTPGCAIRDKLYTNIYREIFSK
ncbi:MAG: flavin oxidoreductase/NADH oxidase [Ruminococcaceae bacterium]|nr:flavin oxidoreductase/NADH oxidase [Oscillospiraceae bacterium]